MSVLSHFGGGVFGLLLRLAEQRLALLQPILGRLHLRLGLTGSRRCVNTEQEHYWHNRLEEHRPTNLVLARGVGIEFGLHLDQLTRIDLVGLAHSGQIGLEPAQTLATSARVSVLNMTTSMRLTVTHQQFLNDVSPLGRRRRNEVLRGVAAQHNLHSTRVDTEQETMSIMVTNAGMVPCAQMCQSRCQASPRSRPASRGCRRLKQKGR